MGWRSSGEGKIRRQRLKSSRERGAAVQPGRGLAAPEAPRVFEQCRESLLSGVPSGTKLFECGPRAPTPTTPIRRRHSGASPLEHRPGWTVTNPPEHPPEQRYEQNLVGKTAERSRPKNTRPNNVTSKTWPEISRATRSSTTRTPTRPERQRDEPAPCRFHCLALGSGSERLPGHAALGSVGQMALPDPAGPCLAS